MIEKTSEMKNLKMIDVSHNNIPLATYRYICDLIQTSSLHLVQFFFSEKFRGSQVQGTQIRELSQTIKSYLTQNSKIDMALRKEIFTLSIVNRKLRKLPSFIFQQHHITSLELNDNMLQTIPSEIGNLLNLVNLDLSNNQITSLPPEIGLLTK